MKSDEMTEATDDYTALSGFGEDEVRVNKQLKAEP